MQPQQSHIACPKCQHRFPASSTMAVEPNGYYERSSTDQTARSDSATGMTFALQDSCSTAGIRARRPRRTWTGRLFRFAMAMSCLLAAVVVLAQVLDWMPRRGSAPSILRSPDGPPGRSASRLPLSDHSPTTTDRSTRWANVSPVLRMLETAVVKIESDRPGDEGALGAGFVIDEAGLVATSYHVVSSATRARVRFHGGAVYDVAGYAAVDPTADLAILKLENSPPDLEAMSLIEDGDPPRLTPIVAVGHPHGIEFSTFDGTVSRVLQTRELPRRSQDFLDRLMISDSRHRWIQHTARIAEGYSGGPLLNERGEVIGINVWMDGETGAGYALHADHLRQLCAKLLPAIAPLDRYAREDARAAALVQGLSESYLNRLLDDARAMKWGPGDATDYEKLQHLAWAVTIANHPATIDGETRSGGLSTIEMDALVRTADRIVATLRKEHWGAPAQMIVINEFAADQVDRPNRGVFFFGTVQRTVSGEDGSRAALVRLAGMDRELFIPLDGQLIDLVPGTSCLVLGVNYQGRIVQYGDNPLQPIVAPVIVSRTIIPLAE